jgi:outer membrane immunogenic protein
MRLVAVSLIAVTAALLPQLGAAADLKVPVYKAPPASIAAYSWTGCYLGIEGGGAWGHSDQIVNGPVGFGSTTGGGYHVSGGLVGGTAGCNYQVDRWVLGIEGDMSWAGVSGTATNIPPFVAGTVVGTRESWLGTVRGRVGFTPADRWLVYATGGLAAADVEATIATAAVGSFSDTQTRTGWTAGLGVETAFWGRWTVKLEYLHVDFSSQAYFTPSPAPAVGINSRGNVPFTEEIVRAGLNLHF